MTAACNLSHMVRTYDCSAGNISSSRGCNSYFISEVLFSLGCKPIILLKGSETLPYQQVSSTDILIVVSALFGFNIMVIISGPFGLSMQSLIIPSVMDS